MSRRRGRPWSPAETRVTAPLTAPVRAWVREHDDPGVSPGPDDQSYSWMYEMSCLKPVTPVMPGTRTGLYDILNWLPISTFVARTWPLKAFWLFIEAVQGV